MAGEAWLEARQVERGKETAPDRGGATGTKGCPEEKDGEHVEANQRWEGSPGDGGDEGLPEEGGARETKLMWLLRRFINFSPRGMGGWNRGKVQGNAAARRRRPGSGGLRGCAPF